MSSRLRRAFEPPHRAFSWSAPGYFCRILPLLVCGGMMSACSLAVPMAGIGSEDLATGSIKQASAASPLTAEMDQEDWRRAKSALDTALDPQGNGATVAWDNPQSGAKGAFVPLAQPFPKDDGICRAFSARLTMKGRDERVLRSSACRVNSGEWIVGKVTPVERSVPATPQERTAHSMPKKSDNLARRDSNTQLR